jgi:hypothetical protein
LGIVAMDLCGAVRELRAAGFTDAQACAVTRLVRAACGPAMPAPGTGAGSGVGVAEAKTAVLKCAVVALLGIQAAAIISAALALRHAVAHG